MRPGLPDIEADKEFNPDIPPPPVPYSGPQKYCFVKHEGEKGEDITALNITVHNDSVSGTLDYRPLQRPPVLGKVQGLMLGRILKLTYSYSMDSVPQMEEIVCKFEDRNLFKKTGDMIKKDSVLVLKDPYRAAYVLYMEQVDCSN